MTDDEPTPVDVRIEPTVRQIGGLSSAFGGSDPLDFGVLTPFSGFLQSSRSHGTDHPTAGPGPLLEYLTLQPLLVEFVRQRTATEPGIATSHRPRTEGTASDGTAGTTAPDADSMTVREYIRHHRTSRPESDDEASHEAAGSERNQGDRRHSTGTVTDHSAREGASGRRTDRRRAGDLGPGVVDRRGAHRQHGGDAGSSTDPPTARRERPLGNTPDAMDHQETTGSDAVGRPDERPRSRSGASDSQPLKLLTGAGENGRSAFVRDHDRSAVGPELVVAEQPLSVGAGRADSGSEDASIVTASRSSTGRGHPDDRQSASASSRGDLRDGHTETTRSETNLGATEPGQQATGSATDRLPFALEEIEQPTLDRFVEQLSEKLARHERVERERRGQ